MTYKRYTGSFEDAVERSLHTIGLNRAAEIVQRQPGTLYDWLNPERAEKLPNIRQAVLLDAEYSRMTGEQPPLYQAYGVLLESLLDGLAMIDPTAALLRLQAAAGRLCDQHQLSLHTLSDGGQKITPRQAAALMEKVSETDLALREYRAALTAIIERGRV